MSNAPETESLKKLIENIDEENLKLPEFQRDFVWSIDKTLELFDSLVKEIFMRRGQVLNYDFCRRRSGRVPRGGDPAGNKK